MLASALGGTGVKVPFLPPSPRATEGSLYTAGHLPYSASPETLHAVGLAPTNAVAASHPLGGFEWHHLMSPQLLECSIMLFFAGVLCSAGGIGGGGIYVTVLMVSGMLSPRDAVPLSKAIVFFGSLSSLVLNLRRSAGSGAGRGEEARGTGIDADICRIVVPTALLGTLLGVCLNQNVSDSFVLITLVTVLGGITCKVTKSTWLQFLEEEEAHKGTSFSTPLPPLVPGQTAATPGTPESHAPRPEPGVTLKRAVVKRKEAAVGAVALLLVVLSGVTRHHAAACKSRGPRLDPGVASARDACHHPALFLAGDGLERWMGTAESANMVMLLTLAVPIVTCTLLSVHSGRELVCGAGWQGKDVLAFGIMGVFTGCLAGLVGIGGGLIFSPFFLLMGVEPAVAVATSSTCVIFTSSSTTMQYLLTDRIIVSLTLIYGVVNLLASYMGTAFVHFLTDRFSGRRSYVSAIVAVGVLVSTGLSITKLASEMSRR